MNTWTGWAIITEIYYMHRQMTVRPYVPTPQTGQFNATATPTDLAADTLRDTLALDPSGNLQGPGQQRTVGTGIGGDTIINFSPRIFRAPGFPIGPGASSDEILLHEMIHGIRQMMGRSVREAVTVNLGMDNYEEFAAITITNVYQSELRIAQLRKDHHGFAPLTGPTTNVSTFKATYQQWLSYLDVEQPRLCQNLRQVNCAFNPFV